MNPTTANQPFAPTRWTLVLRARGETPQARAALSELCEAYYHPVVRFLRREGRDEENARETAQEFFARILVRDGFQQADPERGRFRSYLLGALKHFLADQRKWQERLKRGGGAAAASLDQSDPETGAPLELVDVGAAPPDAIFDREWALAVIRRALEALEREFTAPGKGAHFQALKPWLIGEAPSLSQAEAARGLDLSEGAVKVAIHRLRKRFREAVRAEIAQTLRDPSTVEDELRHLLEALS